MSTSINSVFGSNAYSASFASRMPPRPDTAKMASDLFSKLDSTGKGYLEAADLQSAISGSTSTSTDSLFATLDQDSDGKVTESEFSTQVSQLLQQLDAQLQSDRVSQSMGAQGMPPPPPPPNDTGFTKEELQSQLEEIGSSDSKRSSLISNIVANFEAADTDGDGKVSFAEARAYDESSKSSSTGTSSSDASGTTQSTSSSGLAENELLSQIEKLLRTYLNPDSKPTSSISVSA